MTSRADHTDSSSGLATIVLWALGVMFLLGGVLAAFFFTNFDTQYAPGYSERAFKSIKLGDTEPEVFSLLGNPIFTNYNKPFVEWIYSAEEQSRFAENGAGKGTYTIIHFDDTGRVNRISGARRTSANTFTFGEGQGHLSLTKEQIDQLKGSTQDEIRRKFGSPRAVYEYKASKLLRYSQSPSSANYHLRTVGVDKNGKVVHIGRSIYWD